MKMIIKNLVFSLSLLCSSLLVCDTKDAHEVVLTSEMVHFLDGKSIGVNGGTIKKLLLMRREVKKIQFGEQTNRGITEGHYLFEGKTYSIHALALLESQLEIDYYQKNSDYLQDKSRYARELTTLEASYNATRNELRKVLAQARNEFEQRIRPFEENLRAVKDQMAVLIAESCQKHNRSNCFLLKWVESPAGTEMTYFHDQVSSFKALDQFCSDFTHFLDDLMRSCPKAMAQFKKLMEDQQARR
jgi:hypothetical protein